VVALVAAVAIAAPVAVHAEDPAQELDLVVRVGRLHVGDGKVLAPAVIAIDEGRIVAVAEGSDVPSGVPVRAWASAVACPGFVDAVSQTGLDGSAAESPEALTPDVRAADAFDVRHRDLPAALADGVTTLGLLPGPSNVAAGSAAAASLRADGSAEVVLRQGPPVFAFRAPALGTNRVPSTLAGARAMLEAAFAGRRWTTVGEGAVPARSEAIELLAALRDGRVFVYADDVEGARVAVDTLNGRGLQPTVVGLRAAWDDPDVVASLRVPLVVSELRLGDSEGLLALPARLAERGADVALASGAPGRPLRMALSLAVAHGFPADQAVAAVTLRPARALGVDDRVGSVSAGKRADLMVFDGEPWEPASRLLLSVVGGEIVQDVEGAR
jgi:imidazolonepropionase-like amidohydrolase